ncbi:cyclin-domain-containing protein [Clathrospora elynae]|uniref:Cyclin-domain-containing protein n=1 Tax=Clathrospora elynae TaxID=706981 RepID=A0A6A5T5A4_9PLEO|nr:cyclin-domain-containing protein [Clathrospora elynae]
MIQVCYSAPPSKTVHPRRLVLVPVIQNQTTMDPPSAPNPAGDAGVLPEFGSLSLQDAPSPPANDEELDILTMSRETAMKLIVRSVTAIANAAGDVPATPPVSRPGTPGGKDNHLLRAHRRTASRPATPIPAEKQLHQPTELAPPEASHDEPVTIHDIGAGAQPESVQRANMARKFFSKTVPKVGVEEYMNRIQKFCPLSTAVWLAAGSYILRLCIIDRSVPLTYRTMHRLILACALVAMKALEDHRWPQKRFAAVGGVDEASLSRLELCVEFLLSFDVQIFTPEKLKDLTVQLQNAGQAATMACRLPSSFNLKLGNPKMLAGQVA